MGNNASLPSYTNADTKAALLRAGVSGTIYSLVMPESESALGAVVDGRGHSDDSPSPDLQNLEKAREANFLERYREPWTQKQDSAHEAYFDRWTEWVAPIVHVDRNIFCHTYPTAGASEGIFKIMAEHAGRCSAHGTTASIHIFEGEYEGFSAYAEALNLRIVRHQRDAWRDVPGAIGSDAQFWISQPSAIDGQVWPHFEEFAARMQDESPDVEIIPDLTYVGSVARDFTIDLDTPNIPAIVMSQSKPLGGYYHRVGGVLARREYASLFGNKWFKNLASLAWATLMMERHGVFDLPSKYAPVQAEAAVRAGALLGIDNLEPADVVLLATAPPPEDISPLLSNVLRGTGSDRKVRLCLTPLMTCLIDPDMAQQTMARFGDIYMGKQGA